MYRHSDWRQHGDVERGSCAVNGAGGCAGGGGGAVGVMGMQGGRRGMLEVSPLEEDEVKVKAGSPRVTPRLPIQVLAGREDKVKKH